MTEKNITTEKDYWNSFYSENGVVMPSQFCALFVSEIDSDALVIEFGCGNGRDALFLARHGYNVCAIDLSEEAISHNNLKKKGLDNIEFVQGDVSIEKDVISPIDAMRKKRSNQPLAIYSRFFLHSLDDIQENKFMSALSKSLKEGDRLFFEFRSIEDHDVEKIYENHFRRFVDTQQYLKSLTSDFNFDVLYSITGQGMAKYKEEDPFVTRIIATKKG